MGSVFMTIIAVSVMVDDGHITRFDVMQTIVFALIFWPIGFLMLIVFLMNEFDWDKTVWESEEHKRTKARIYTERSEEE
jgi:predicted ABC-type exoprotein transport system permease subunit